MMPEFNTCILGSGWAGLLVANRITEIGIKDIALIEESESGELGVCLEPRRLMGLPLTAGDHIFCSAGTKRYYQKL